MQYIITFLNIHIPTYIYINFHNHFLQLFYVHFTNVEDRPIQSSTKGLINWTSKMLKDRQLQELSKGGFGNVTISSQHIDMSHCEQGIF